MKQFYLLLIEKSLRHAWLLKILLAIYVKINTRRTLGEPRPLGASEVLLIYEPRFKYIVSEAIGRGIKIDVIGRGIFDYLFKKLLANYSSANERNFGEYALSSYLNYPTERSRYLSACRRIAYALKAICKYRCVILPKYNDDYTLELIRAFHEAGFVTVVYDREGTVTSRRMEFVPQIVAQQAPGCDFVVTYNEAHKEFFDRIFRISQTPPPTITIIGNPGSDEWFLNERLKANAAEPFSTERCRILFFAFGEFSYVYDTDYLKGKEQIWRSLLHDTHCALAGDLERFPAHELWYKRGPKGNRDYWAGSEEVLAMRNATLIDSKANSNELIAKCDVVIAFQTTAIIDAMFSNKPIIYCAWGPAYDELRADLIRFDEFAETGAIFHAKSEAELLALLSSGRRLLDINFDARKRIREQFSSNPDGCVSRRFVDWLIEAPLQIR